MSTNRLRLFLEENFPARNLIIVSNREPYIHKKAGEQIKAVCYQPTGKGLLAKLLRRLKEELIPIPGVIVEDKGITASVHFRMVSPEDRGKFFDTFWKTVKEHEDLFRITSGRKVLEIRPLKTWHKRDAVSWILENLGKRKIPVYLGDDTTDKDAFKVIKGKGLSICIGGNLEADYYLKNQSEVKGFLEGVAIEENKK